MGYFIVLHAAAAWLRKSNPQEAHLLAPGDGQAKARLAASLIAQNVSAADRRRAVGLARAALRREPTAVAALTTLGLDAGARGDVQAARRLFAFSERLSRRDLQTQLWLIEDRVNRGDVAGALRQYDIALRTSRSTADLLFPVLVSAVSTAPIRQGMVEILSARPAWGESFISYAASKGSDPQPIAQLFLDLRKAAVPVPQQASALVINGLIAKGLTDRAWTYYAAVRPGANRRSSRDPHFDPDITAPSLLDWVPVNDTGMMTSIQRGERGGVFDFVVPASLGGALLQQIQLLPLGTYRLTGHSTGIDQPENAQPYWVLRCQESGREIGRVDVPNSARNGGRFDGSFRVPAGCAVQFLILMAQPTETASSMAGQIDEVRLAPVATGPSR